jgi:hypothetical protein
MRMRSGAGLAALLGLATLPGCADAGRVAVEGTVTYDGQPVQAGVIAFVPAGGQGLSSGGSIVDGKYHIPAKYGPRTGPYRVEIRWAKPTGQKFKSETGALLERTQEGLPAKYHDESRLTANLKKGVNTVNFDLEK